MLQEGVTFIPRPLPAPSTAGIEAMNAAEAEEAKQPKQVSDPGRFHGGVP